MQQQYVGLGYLLFACFNAGCYGCSRGDIVPWRDVLYHLSKSLSVNNVYRQHVCSNHVRYPLGNALCFCGITHSSSQVPTRLTVTCLGGNSAKSWSCLLQNSTTYCALHDFVLISCVPNRVLALELSPSP